MVHAFKPSTAEAVADRGDSEFYLGWSELHSETISTNKTTSPNQTNGEANLLSLSDVTAVSVVV